MVSDFKKKVKMDGGAGVFLEKYSRETWQKVFFRK
jgi:hypothetical protein